MDTSEKVFNALLEKLDNNQQSIWQTIIVRHNNTVTEVDGTNYRKTGSFGDSSKVINS